MRDLITSCIDLNTPYCPCILAETNNCVFCSHLAGKEVCECNWAGICVYNEKHWQSKLNIPSGTHAATRIEYETEFTIQEQITDNVYILNIPVSIELASSLRKVGSFVFLQNSADKLFFQFPVGVMKVFDTSILVAIEVLGPKSKRVFHDNNRMILVRGPYYNGVFGQPWIEKISCGKIILVAGGMGQAPAVAIANNLLRNSNNILALFAPGRVGKVFAAREFNQQEMEITIVPSFRKEGMSLLREWLKQKPDLIISAGPDQQHYGIINLMHDEGIDIPMAATNNNIMCCGEGVCGSCERLGRNNKAIKTCKVQLAFNKLTNSY